MEPVLQRICGHGHANLEPSRDQLQLAGLGGTFIPANYPAVLKEMLCHVLTPIGKACQHSAAPGRQTTTVWGLAVLPIPKLALPVTPLTMSSLSTQRHQLFPVQQVHPSHKWSQGKNPAAAFQDSPSTAQTPPAVEAATGSHVNLVAEQARGKAPAP